MQEDKVRHCDSLYLGEGVCGLKEGNTNSLILWYFRCVERQEQIPDRSMETEFAPALQEKGTQDKWNTLSKHTFLFNFSHVEKPLVSWYWSPKNQTSLRPIVLTTWKKDD